MIEIWINCPDRATARGLADRLIADRLVACANIFPEIESLYRWKGVIENEPEVPLVVKTRADLFETVAGFVCMHHPYETPSVIGVPVESVNHDYLQWVYAETGSGQG
jgi:periplasmic divalent cation tolerance protein